MTQHENFQSYIAKPKLSLPTLKVSGETYNKKSQKPIFSDLAELMLL